MAGLTRHQEEVISGVIGSSCRLFRLSGESSWGRCSSSRWFPRPISVAPYSPKSAWARLCLRSAPPRRWEPIPVRRSPGPESQWALHQPQRL